jgi:5'-deoxynucleotidase YfbR-like HD superfamily hydrolase
MDITWLNVADTAVKIGLGALISAASGYVVLRKSQSYEESKEVKNRFYKLQEEKKPKYVEFLAQSQELIQSNLFKSTSPDSDEYKLYLRAFNEVQIISNDEIRVCAFNLMSDVGSFVFLRKNEQEIELVDSLVKAAREKVSIFQKAAQLEVTKTYKKT